jgi:hypothetical protein
MAHGDVSVQGGTMTPLIICRRVVKLTPAVLYKLLLGSSKLPGKLAKPAVKGSAG